MALFGRKNNRSQQKEDSSKVSQSEQAVVAEEPLLPPAPRNDETGRRAVKDHQNYLLSLVDPLEPFGVQLLDAWGLNSCENLKSLSDLPAQDSAKYLGFAVSSLDILGARPQAPARLKVIPGPVDFIEANQCVLIADGAPLPVGADTVIAYSDGTLDDGYLVVTKDLDAGVGVLPKGTDVVIGDEVLKVDQRIGARQIGLLAGLGVDKVLVRPKPRVVVISVDEWAFRSKTDQLGHSIDINSFMLAAAARSAGAQVWRLNLRSRDDAEIKMTISDQLIRADIIVTTGGIEPDSSEALLSIVPQLGECDFTQLAMAPQQYHGFGLIGEEKVPIVMLPQDPVSAYTGFTLFVAPMIRKLKGITPAVPEPIRCFASTVIRSTPGVSHFIRGVYTDQGGRRMVRPAGSDRDHLLSDLSAANCIIGLGPEVTSVTAGDPVMVLPLTDD